MDKRRPEPVPSKGHQDAFMDALFEGLGPSDFVNLTSSPPAQRKQSHASRLSPTRPIKHAPPLKSGGSVSVASAVASHSRMKTPQAGHAKSMVQVPQAKRQGSLMRFLAQPPSTSAVSEAREIMPSAVCQEAFQSLTGAPASTKSPPNTKLFDHSRKRPLTLGADLRHPSANNPPCARSFSPNSSIKSNTPLVKRVSDLELSQSHISRGNDVPKVAPLPTEDYQALFMDLEEGWEVMSEDGVDNQTSTVPLSRQYTRCVVCDILTAPEWNGLTRRMERTIEVKLHQPTLVIPKKLLLCDEWADTLLELEDELNLVSLPGFAPLDLTQSVITFSRTAPGHLIILFPSLLINITAVSTAPSCTRRGVLNDRIKNSQNEIGEAVIRGTIVHEVIQNMLLPSDPIPHEEESARHAPPKEVWPMSQVTKEARKACVRHVGDLLMIQHTVDSAFEMISEHLNQLPAWSTRYIVQPDRPGTYSLKVCMLSLSFIGIFTKQISISPFDDVCAQERCTSIGPTKQCQTTRSATQDWDHGHLRYRRRDLVTQIRLERQNRCHNSSSSH